RARVATARKKALRDLESELDRPTHPELAERLGVPTPEKQRAMLRALATELSARRLHRSSRA
ncbi:MAG: hypothetical protein ACRELY_17685, partial [Polyangiaceae bacterium]